MFCCSCWIYEGNFKIKNAQFQFLHNIKCNKWAIDMKCLELGTFDLGYHFVPKFCSILFKLPNKQPINI